MKFLGIRPNNFTYPFLFIASANLLEVNHGRAAHSSPDEMTLVSVLGTCGELGNLDLGRWVEGFVVEHKMTMNSYIGSALVSMYGKCGDLTSARRIFDSMAKKDVVTWNAIITG
ncbi:pentatricopeptide repeat-containing protein [Senna tora]|uniref:Pentatricopeptide repeat-containing protein n=1 Tax=Senna tora TaxID=362788 RepID=A0A834WZ93_9FABA|nr:pentatricopeptide repeat-containing protein [Senna tora]